MSEETVNLAGHPLGDLLLKEPADPRLADARGRVDDRGDLLEVLLILLECAASETAMYTQM